AGAHGLADGGPRRRHVRRVLDRRRAVPARAHRRRRAHRSLAARLSGLAAHLYRAIFLDERPRADAARLGPRLGRPVLGLADARRPPDRRDLRGEVLAALLPRGRASGVGARSSVRDQPRPGPAPRRPDAARGGGVPHADDPGMARAPAGCERAGDADPECRSRARRPSGAPARDGRRDEPSAARQDADPGHAGQDRRRDGARRHAAPAPGRAHERYPVAGAQVLEREDRRAPRDRGHRVNVAVLGASHGGFTTAADLALAGHAVRLWARSAQALGPLARDPTIVLTAEGRSGTARLARATTDLAEALAGAEIVIAPIPATGHDDLAKSLAPHVNERQIILLTPGTLGSYAIARALARAGARQ